MAPTKKNVTVNKEEAKAVVKKVPAKAGEVKTEAPKVEEVKAEAPKAEEVKAEAPKAAKPAAEKKAAKSTEKKPAGRKPAAAAKKSTAKKELKAEISVQFDGKSYSQEDLIKIAKDVWKYDLNQKAGDLTSIELYVKPEEHVAYYVMNKDFAGSFYL